MCQCTSRQTISFYRIRTSGFGNYFVYVSIVGAWLLWNPSVFDLVTDHSPLLYKLQNKNDLQNVPIGKCRCWEAKSFLSTECNQELQTQFVYIQNLTGKLWIREPVNQRRTIGAVYCTEGYQDRQTRCKLLLLTLRGMKQRLIQITCSILLH